MSPKEKAFKQMSLFCRLRDALDWSRANYQDVTGIQPQLLVVKCCTCKTIGTWKYKMQAGHFIPRGSRGQSGVYFDERNVHAQCKECNGFKEGNTLVYLEYMVEKYSQAVVDELRALDRMVKSYGSVELMGYELLFKKLYSELLEEF